MRSLRRPRNSSIFSPLIRRTLEAKPKERRLRLDLALPSSVRGPVDFCALAWLAMICGWVAIYSSPLGRMEAPLFLIPLLSAGWNARRVQQSRSVLCLAEEKAKTFAKGRKCLRGLEILPELS